ncbi:hypothetical protein C8J57DRAFT_1256756 [Mycena rebaudengoi]|nr:hypothetical protein C8J57DRAFT_1256756 [Mycena rebaudengoi]
MYRSKTQRWRGFVERGARWQRAVGERQRVYGCEAREEEEEEEEEGSAARREKDTAMPIQTSKRKKTGCRVRSANAAAEADAVSNRRSPSVEELPDNDVPRHNLLPDDCSSLLMDDTDFHVTFNVPASAPPGFHAAAAVIPTPSTPSLDQLLPEVCAVQCSETIRA